MVCAEPLEFVAYASCGHKETCSRCVARLRFVLKDKRCVICQQQSPAVVATRNMGTYTKLLPAQDFDRLQARSLKTSMPDPGDLQHGLKHTCGQDLVSQGELHYLPAAEAYFDDVDHLELVKYVPATSTLPLLLPHQSWLLMLMHMYTGACADTHTHPWMASSGTSPALTDWCSMCRRRSSCHSALSAWRAAR